MGHRPVHSESFEQAEKLKDSGHFAEALEIYQSLANSASDPGQRTVLLLRQVSCLVALNQRKEARTLLDAIASSLPPISEIQILFQLENANLLMVEGKDHQALEGFNALLERYGAILRSSSAGMYEGIQMRRGMLLAERDLWVEGLQAMNEVREWFGETHGTLLYYLGYCYRCLREMAQAKAVLLQALKLGVPRHLEFRAHFTLGIAYYHLEAYAEAKEEFLICAERGDNPYGNNASLWRSLAATHDKLGLRNEAERYVELAKQSLNEASPSRLRPA